MNRKEIGNSCQCRCFSTDTIVFSAVFFLYIAVTGLPLLLYPKFMGLGLSFFLMSVTEFVLGSIIYTLYFKKTDSFPVINKSLLVKCILIICCIQLMMYISGTHGTGNIQLNSSSLLPLTMLVLIVPFYEEVFYRGCLLDVLFSVFKGRYFFPYVINSVIFCLMHTQYHAFNEYFVLFVISLMFTYIRVKSNSIIHSVIAHSSMNAFFVFINMQVFF